MTLVSADDLEEAEAIITNRASKEFPLGVLWIGGEFNGKCSSVEVLSTGNFVRSWRTCTDLLYSYCSFYGKQFIYEIFSKI